MNTAALAAPCWFVVDDESTLLNLAATMLRKFSRADVRACADPCEALGHMTAAPAGLELLVTDLNMPGMNGLELARRVRTLAPQAKVLLTTGSTLSPDDRDALRDQGVDLLLPKPYGYSDLMAAVRHLCGTECFRLN
ncbi:MAG: signal transduction histidine kinase nitrogen specific NtrB [Limisphaerales bacterium]|nr:MAG: signal transduction histidine kinase nitrogen specific NtrB [Limisphaerales bacterium]KAG0506882.1 MAG: signal transduction histidine kinase nitrogen specific NtrB [Limisphaerales bacterium]TXT46610.1 MAG: signal transduction histidine kinase nitrogen specific NtrB [Limisphaerales bacterium]